VPRLPAAGVEAGALPHASHVTQEGQAQAIALDDQGRPGRRQVHTGAGMSDTACLEQLDGLLEHRTKTSPLDGKPHRPGEGIAPQPPQLSHEAEHAKYHIWFPGSLLHSDFLNAISRAWR
jgi:hypothetical protein